LFLVIFQSQCRMYKKAEIQQRIAFENL